MENVVEMINESPHLGETEEIDNGVSQLQGDDMGFHGFRQLKDSEGDDVFVEAVDAQPEEIHSQEEELQPRMLDSDCLDVNGLSNGGHEFENFEEVMDLASGDRGQEEEEQVIVVEEKIEDLVVAETIHEVGVSGEGVDVKDNSKEVLPAQSNGLVNAGVIDTGDADVEEDADVVINGETTPLTVEVKDGTLDFVVEKSPNGDLGQVNLAEAPLIHEKLGNGDVEKVDSDEIELSQGNLANLNQDDRSGELNVDSAYLEDTEQQHCEVGELNDSSANPDSFIDEETETVEPAEEDINIETPLVHEKLGNGDAKKVLSAEIELSQRNGTSLHQDNKGGESKVTSADLGTEHEHCKGEELKDTSVDGETEAARIKTPPTEEDSITETPLVHDEFENGDAKKVDSDEIDLSQGNETNLPQDDKSEESRDASADLKKEHQYYEGGELKDSSGNLDTSVDEPNETAEIKTPPVDEDSTTKVSEKIKIDTTESEAKDCRDYQPHAENIEECLCDRADVKETETLDEGENRSERKTEPEIQPVANVGSSAGNSVGPDPPPSLPSGFRAAASLLEPPSRAVGEEIEAYTDSQSQCDDENIEERLYSHADVKEPEVLEAQEEGKKNRSEGKTVPEILPAANVVPSTGNSVGPAQPLPPPAGLGAAAPLLDPAPHAVQQARVNGAVPQRQAQVVEDLINGEAEENDETREKLQMIRVKFLRLAHRLGQTPHNVVVSQVLYRLGLAEQLRGRNTGRAGAFSFERASAMAVQLEATAQEPLDFSCTIMVLGKTGVGKSATINSIFDEMKFSTDAFQVGTKKVQDVVGTVQGIKVRVIDTPGLLPSWSDQRQNEKILHSVKCFIRKTPPDIVLYLDRLDMRSRDFGDMPLLRTITGIFGPSIWFNAIGVLTHAASAPPDGPNGTASSYEMFVTQRSHVVQQAIRQAAGDMRLMNPVSLVENHSACRTNRAGQRVLPNGQVWKPHLFLLSFATKILAEANTLLKLQDSPPGKPFATRSRVPPLPFLLSSLLQSRPQLKLPEEQHGDEDTLDEDLDEASDSDGESDYDELPPFKSLTKAQQTKLSKAQKKAYYDELEYREKLFMKKQLKEEKKRRKFLKKMAASAKDMLSDYSENVEDESGGAASVPVPMPDLALPTSFDSDNPTHRYRCLDSSNQWLVRPVLETHGWDHDVGYEGINVERLFMVKDNIPLSLSGQVTKDKKESNLQMELASSVNHGEGKATSLGFDMQTVGKDMAYTLRSETRFSNFRHNKTAAGLSVTLLGDALATGVKLEDKLIVNKRFRLVMSGGAMTGRGDVAYGGSLEATLRDKDYPLGRTLSTLGLSIMDWHGDLAIGCNLQSQFPVGRSTNMIARANLNNRGAGQVSIRLNSSEQLQIALVSLVPLFRRLLDYSQQIQFGQ